MTSDEFAQVFSEFNENYGKPYGKTLADKIFAYVKWISAGEFKFRLENIMDENLKAPGIGKIKADFRETVNRARQDYAKLLVDGEPNCKFCQKSGMVSAVSYDKGLGYKTTFAFRCTQCRVAEILGLSRELRPWNPDDKRFVNQTELLAMEPKRRINVEDFIKDICSKDLTNHGRR